MLIGIRLRKPDEKSPLELLKEVLPYIFVATILIGAAQYLFPEGVPKPSWYRRIWNILRWKCRKWRLAAVGW